jgi:phage terminase small subunit
MSKPTPKQQRFVEEYLVDLNATQAAIRAGYSERTARSIASQLLTKLNIQAAIQQARQKLAENAAVHAEDVVRELKKVGFADIRIFIEWDKEGKVTLKPSDEIRNGLGACISEISQGKDGIRLKLHPKLKALELLGQYLGIFDGTAEDASADKLADLIEKMEAAADAGLQPEAG